MRYVILIHSNPQPWGHPTPDFLPEFKDLTNDERNKMYADFDKLLAELKRSGELVSGEALGAPQSAKLCRWDDGKSVVSKGPYSETEEHLAGLFMINVASQERAEELALLFSSPGETVELRPAM